MKRIALLCLCAIFALANVQAVLAKEQHTIRIEGEWCETFNVLPYEYPVTCYGLQTFPTGGTSAIATLSNGIAASVCTDAGVPIPEGGYYLTYDFYVPEAGFYLMEYVGSKQGKIGFETRGYANTSAFTMQVNGGAKRFINPNAQTGGFTLASIPSAVRNNFAKYKYDVYLEQGMNSITFWIEDYNQAGAVAFYLDYFELTYRSKTDARFETEYYAYTTPASISETALFPAGATTYGGLSQGKLLQMSAPYTLENTGVSVFLDVYIPKSGAYCIETVCGELGKGYTTDFDVICEGERISFKEGSAEKKADISDVWDAVLLKRYVSNGAMYMEAGDHQIEIRVSDKREAADDYLTYIDYLQFVDADVASGGTINIEAESNTQNQYWTRIGNEEMSGGAGIQLYEHNTEWRDVQIEDQFLLEYPFTAPAEDAYDLLFSMSPNHDNLYFSPLEFSIDDGSWIQLSAGNCYLVDTIGSLRVDQYGVYQYAEPVALSAGAHKISVRIRERRAAAGDLWYVCFFDRIQLKSDAVLARVEAELDTSALTAGASAGVAVTAHTDKGGVVSDCEISLASSDENVFTVDADTGMVTAKNPGSAKLLVSCEDSAGNRVQSETEITVFSDKNAVILQDAAYADGALTVTLSQPWGGGAPVTVFAAVYEKTEAGLSSIVSSNMAEFKAPAAHGVAEDELHGALPRTVTLPLEHVESGSVIKVYLLDNWSSMLPVWKCVEVL